MPTPETSLDPGTLDFDKGDGLIPVIAQHWLTGEVLMLGYATREALDASLETGRLTFHSRSRDALWTKGETSGNTLRIVSLHGDCDGDAILARVHPAGPTCHTGERSCFGAPPTLRGLADVLAARKTAADAAGSAAGDSGGAPSSSWTVRLLGDRNLRLKKLGEEASELVLACADEDRGRVKEEAADVVYHTLVAALAAGVEIDDILEALESRRSQGGAGPNTIPAAG
ncbi:MAG: bifunctional phosphoribosyl-AMP cyclohydrolase/phosphoribosyl-ATP diphosphatase HisIE [Candidatus Longimicrobiales bacterium M2_2A_002]